MPGSRIWQNMAEYGRVQQVTRSSTVIISTYQLLVLDGYNSYILPEFDQFYLDHQIVVLCILAHLLYLLQPLDIGCFLVLKQSYKCLIKQIIGRGVNCINKRKFLPLYRQARQTALHQNNIQAGFAATGLVLYSPKRVLVQLYDELDDIETNE